jgi:hypothetical protein
MVQDLHVQGFSTYAGFNGTVASVVTRAEMGIADSARADSRGLFEDYRRPAVPGDFPGSSQINRNSSQLRILEQLEGQFNRTQDSRDVAGQTLSSLRDTEGNNKEKTLKEIKAYKDTLTNENNKLIKNGSSQVQKQKKDKENASIADQIAKSRGQTHGGKNVSQMEIDAFKAAASKPASVKAQVLKKKNKKKPAKPKGRKK